MSNEDAEFGVRSSMFEQTPVTSNSELRTLLLLLLRLLPGHFGLVGVAGQVAGIGASVCVIVPRVCVIAPSRCNCDIAPTVWYWISLPRRAIAAGRRAASSGPARSSRTVPWTSTVSVASAAAPIGAAHDGDIRVIPPDGDLDVPPGAGHAERRVHADPAVRRHERLRPGVRRAALRDVAEVAADIARREARVAAEREEEVREILADAAAARDHVRDGRVDIRRAELVGEVLADVGRRALEEGEGGRLRRGGEQGARQVAESASSAT